MGYIADSRSASSRTEIRRRELVHKIHVLRAENVPTILIPVREVEAEHPSTRESNIGKDLRLELVRELVQADAPN